MPDPAPQEAGLCVARTLHRNFKLWASGGASVFPDQNPPPGHTVTDHVPSFSHPVSGYAALRPCCLGTEANRNSFLVATFFQTEPRCLRARKFLFPAQAESGCGADSTEEPHILEFLTGAAEAAIRMLAEVTGLLGSSPSHSASSTPQR